MGVSDTSGHDSGSSDWEQSKMDWLDDEQVDADKEVALVVPALPLVGDTAFNEETEVVEGVGGSVNVDKAK